MKPITINDLYKYNFLSEINCSPNGSKLLFTHATANEKQNNYTCRLHCMDTATGEHRAISAKGAERSAIWLDDSTVLFSSAGENKDGKTTYFSLDINGGEAQKAFTIDAKVKSIAKLCEHRFLLTVSRNVSDEPKPSEHRAQQGKDFLIFDEIPYWANGQGIVNKQRSALAVYDSCANSLEIISDKYTNVGGYTLSEDKTKVLFWGTTYTDKMSVHSELYEHHLASGFTKKLVPEGLYGIMKAIYFGDTILFEGSDKKRNSSQDPTLLTVSSDGKISDFVYLDGALSSSAGSDMSYGGGRTTKLIGDKLYCLFTSWGNSFLSVLDQSGKLSHVNQTVGAVNCFDIVGDTAYCVAFRDFCPAEIYAINLNDGSERCLTGFNADFVKNHEIIKPDRFVFKSKHGHELEGFVLKPQGYKPGEKYPGVLNMHGGPKAAFGSIYHHEMQCLAHMGHFVFFTNPRGSSGRGDEFSTLVGKLGEDDYSDFIEFTDEVISRYPDLDDKRIGISGGSYGGFMCNYMIGKTDRFKAAVSQRSISNYLSKCLTTDIGYYHNLSQVASSPWDNPEKMWHHSPLKYVQNAVTPTLFIQSDEDYRCWMSDPIMMFTNLRKRGIPSKIALFHGENHELSRSGKPHNRINRLLELCEWFKKYL